MRGLIAILSDFGNKDHYNGVMKGVIFSINPKAKIVDLALDTNSFSITDAAFMLLASVKYFPKNTIFLVVVDPGVGTKRAAVAVEGSKHFFVGPDNGVLYPALQIEGIKKAVRLKTYGGTFDGRDVFAPAAAMISLKNGIEGLGEKYELSVKTELKNAEIRGGTVWGKVIHVDKFGDIVTNIRSEQLMGYSEITLDKTTIKRAESFSECDGLCFIEGSSGYIEIIANKNNASEMLGLNTDDSLRIIVK